MAKLDSNSLPCLLDTLGGTFRNMFSSRVFMSESLEFIFILMANVELAEGENF